MNGTVIPSTVFPATKDPSGLIYLHKDDLVTLVNASGLDNVLAPRIIGTAVGIPPPPELGGFSGVNLIIADPSLSVVASLYLELVDPK